jgi:hypothetical protein
VTSESRNTEVVYNPANCDPYFIEFGKHSEPIRSYTLSTSSEPFFRVLDGAYINPMTKAGSWDMLNGIEADTSSAIAPCGLVEWRSMGLTVPSSSIRPAWKRHENQHSCYHCMLDMIGTDSIATDLQYRPIWPIHIRSTLYKKAIRDKESLHLALPFNIPNATVRIGIGDTCVTPESGRIPGIQQRLLLRPALDRREQRQHGRHHRVPARCDLGSGRNGGRAQGEPRRGTNPEYYKAWKTEAKSSSTIYLYALNNYWHTNFKADQEGPITFDLYLKMHGPFKLEEARRFGLEMTRPLITWWK